ncbi:MAG: phospholipase D family protein [Parvibaculum sp.]|nr:phospholipase D family protein [Parvibaculum sp.]
MKIRFVADKKIIDEVQSLIGRSSDVSAAVAYWGKNSVKETGITQRKKGSTRILCDLFSGACNPDEVLKLLKCGVEVKTLDGMHAKVWVNRDTAIVGSANASANGLGFEGSK